MKIDLYGSDLRAIMSVPFVQKMAVDTCQLFISEIQRLCVLVDCASLCKWIAFISRFYPKLFTVLPHIQADGGANHAR